MGMKEEKTIGGWKTKLWCPKGCGKKIERITTFGATGTSLKAGLYCSKCGGYWKNNKHLKNSLEQSSDKSDEETNDRRLK